MRLFWAAASWLALAAPAAALEISPLYRLQVLGGQYFFAGDKASLSGNASGLAAPALKFDEAWALLPALQASYQGTKQVKDLTGAGTMFQEQMDYRASARLVWAPEGTRWRFKPAFSYKYELLKETKDESWGSGLFDYQKWSFGLETEYLWQEPFSWRFGVDYYEVAFPNYISLESQAARRFPGQSLARELAGDRVLDTQNLSVATAFDAPVHERLVLDSRLQATYQRYPKQRVVAASGELTAAARQDVLAAASLSARMPHELNRDLRLLGSLDLALAYNSSNQNDYDAANTRYSSFYYNYGELRIGPALRLQAGLQGPASRPVVLGVSGSWWQRRYPYRTAQDASGRYVYGGLRASGWMTQTSLEYPMAKRFSLTFEAQYGQAASNHKFEQFYRYNYTVANYLFGLTYEY
ncbi:MAG: hypothetical protein WC881_09480 [Elusimicrobiota bacterium]|jgi:hypothetical protein